MRKSKLEVLLDKYSGKPEFKLQLDDFLHTQTDIGTIVHVDKLYFKINTVLRELLGDGTDCKSVYSCMQLLYRICKNEKCFAPFVQLGLTQLVMCWTLGRVEHNEEDKVIYDNILDTVIELAGDIEQLSDEGQRVASELFVPYFVGLLADVRRRLIIRLEACKFVNSAVATYNTIKPFPHPETLSFVEHFDKTLASVGDLECQLNMMEALFRLVKSPVTRRTLAQKFWSKSPELLETFTNIRDGEFESDSRKFVNKFNESLPENIRRVFTLPCKEAYLGTYKVPAATEEGADWFWTDFNKDSNCVTFFACISTEDDDTWDAVAVKDYEVTEIRINERPETNEIAVVFTMDVSLSRLLTICPDQEESYVKLIYDQKNSPVKAISFVYPKCTVVLPKITTSPDMIASTPPKTSIAINAVHLSSRSQGVANVIPNLQTLRMKKPRGGNSAVSLRGLTTKGRDKDGGPHTASSADDGEALDSGEVLVVDSDQTNPEIGGARITGKKQMNPDQDVAETTREPETRYEPEDNGIAMNRSDTHKEARNEVENCMDQDAIAKTQQSGTHEEPEKEVENCMDQDVIAETQQSGTHKEPENEVENCMDQDAIAGRQQSGTHEEPENEVENCMDQDVIAETQQSLSDTSQPVEGEDEDEVDHAEINDVHEEPRPVYGDEAKLAPKKSRLNKSLSSTSEAKNTSSISKTAMERRTRRDKTDKIDEQAVLGSAKLPRPKPALKGGKPKKTTTSESETTETVDKISGKKNTLSISTRAERKQKTLEQHELESAQLPRPKPALKGGKPKSTTSASSESETTETADKTSKEKNAPSIFSRAERKLKTLEQHELESAQLPRPKPALKGGKPKKTTSASESETTETTDQTSKGKNAPSIFSRAERKLKTLEQHELESGYTEDWSIHFDSDMDRKKSLERSLREVRERKEDGKVSQSRFDLTRSVFREVPRYTKGPKTTKFFGEFEYKSPVSSDHAFSDHAEEARKKKKETEKIRKKKEKEIEKEKRRKEKEIEKEKETKRKEKEKEKIRKEKEIEKEKEKRRKEKEKEKEKENEKMRKEQEKEKEKEKEKMRKKKENGEEMEKMRKEQQEHYSTGTITDEPDKETMNKQRKTVGKILATSQSRKRNTTTKAPSKSTEEDEEDSEDNVDEGQGSEETQVEVGAWGPVEEILRKTATKTKAASYKRNTKILSKSFEQDIQDSEEQYVYQVQGFEGTEMEVEVGDEAEERVVRRPRTRSKTRREETLIPTPLVEQSREAIQIQQHPTVESRPISLNIIYEGGSSYSLMCNNVVEKECAEDEHDPDGGNRWGFMEIVRDSFNSSSATSSPTAKKARSSSTISQESRALTDKSRALTDKTTTTSKTKPVAPSQPTKPATRREWEAANCDEDYEDEVHLRQRMRGKISLSTEADSYNFDIRTPKVPIDDSGFVDKTPGSSAQKRNRRDRTPGRESREETPGRSGAKRPRRYGELAWSVSPDVVNEATTARRRAGKKETASHSTQEQQHPCPSSGRKRKEWEDDDGLGFVSGPFTVKQQRRRKKQIFPSEVPRYRQHTHQNQDNDDDDDGDMELSASFETPAATEDQPLHPKRLFPAASGRPEQMKRQKETRRHVKDFRNEEDGFLDETPEGNGYVDDQLNLILASLRQDVAKTTKNSRSYVNQIAQAMMKVVTSRSEDMSAQHYSKRVTLINDLAKRMIKEHENMLSTSQESQNRAFAQLRKQIEIMKTNRKEQEQSVRSIVDILQTFTNSFQELEEDCHDEQANLHNDLREEMVQIRNHIMKDVQKQETDSVRRRMQAMMGAPW